MLFLCVYVWFSLCSFPSDTGRHVLARSPVSARTATSLSTEKATMPPRIDRIVVNNFKSYGGENVIGLSAFPHAPCLDPPSTESSSVVCLSLTRSSLVSSSLHLPHPRDPTYHMNKQVHGPHLSHE